MSVQEYFYDLKWAPYGADKDDRGHIEDAVLGFLLRRAETLELTAYPQRTRLSLGSFVVRAYTSVEEKDGEFAKARAVLQPFLSKKTTDNRKYGVPQGAKAIFHHYFYRLAPEVCSMLVDAGLIWTRDSAFCGFEDPTFYRTDGSLLARIVTHENFLSFFLSSEELIELEKRGISLTRQMKYY
jgi:hypothetical protein